MLPLRCFARASITAQGHAFVAFSTFSRNPRTSMLEEASRSSKMLAPRASSKPQELEMLAKRPQKRLHEAPKRRQMALRRPPNRPRGVQDASGGLFEPLQSPRSRKNDPRTSVFRASSKPQGSKTVAQGRFAGLFEQRSKQRSKRLRSSAKPLGSKRLSWKRLSWGVGRRRTRGQ